MRCRNCGHPDTKVLESRESQAGATVRRRRECLECGWRMTTFERVEEVPLYVLKRSGSREVFSAEKLRRSLELAFRKRRFDPNQIESIVRRVESALRESGEREVSTSQVGEQVLHLLRDVDPVAYVRFASVYRAFASADDFVRELKGLDDPVPTPSPFHGAGRPALTNETGGAH
jgi:transcriptional repressor NrdR